MKTNGKRAAPCAAPCRSGTGTGTGTIPWRAMSKIAPHRGMVLPAGSEERKATPIFSGVLNYFPLAIAAVARLSKRGNDKHNPGQPLHWAREKSTDQPDCIARHLIDVYSVDPETGEYEDAAAVAWRALALLQLLEEERLGKPPSRGSSGCPPKPRKR